MFGRRNENDKTESFYCEPTIRSAKGNVTCGGIVDEVRREEKDFI